MVDDEQGRASNRYVSSTQIAGKALGHASMWPITPGKDSLPRTSSYPSMQATLGAVMQRHAIASIHTGSPRRTGYQEAKTACGGMRWARCSTTFGT